MSAFETTYIGAWRAHAPATTLIVDRLCRRARTDYDPIGFVYVTVLQENLDGGAPDSVDGRDWADEFGITLSNESGLHCSTGVAQLCQSGTLNH